MTRPFRISSRWAACRITGRAAGGWDCREAASNKPDSKNTSIVVEKKRSSFMFVERDGTTVDTRAALDGVTSTY